MGLQKTIDYFDNLLSNGFEGSTSCSQVPQAAAG
jgi:hypothetical protein